MTPLTTTPTASKAVSDDFICGSEFAAAWNQLKKRAGVSRLAGVRLERAMGESAWKTAETGSRADLFDFVRGLDRAPIPGRFRLAVG